MTPRDIARRARLVLDTCREQGIMLATAESCTGGLIAGALTEIAGSSDVLERGFVTYSNEAKTEQLGVAADLIAGNGAVSEPVARAMAEGAIARSRADLAVAVTGIAGPGGGSAEKPVGLVHIACARKRRDTLHERHVFRGNRASVRQASVAAAFDMVLRQAMRGRRKVALPGRRAPRFAIGVDFSGAADAGRRIWIAKGAIDGETVRIETCVPASSLPGGGVGRERAIAALVERLAAETDAIVGLDFPFGLPAAFVRAASWERFVDGFPRRFADPEAVYRLGVTKPGRSEPKRQTDAAAHTPFSPLNLRVYRQTWSGIAELLRPLLRGGRARVLPMQAPAAGVPLLVEICPASMLWAEGLDLPYKGRTSSHRIARRAILDALIARGALAEPAPEIARAAIDRIEGDALDALIAAVGAHRALYDPRLVEPPEGAEAIEGRVFF